MEEYDTPGRINEYKGIEEEDFDYDELIELYDVAKQIELDIKILWKNTVGKYLRYCEEREILTQSPDYVKFYDYMLKHNTMYKYVLDRIYELEH